MVVNDDEGIRSGRLYPRVIRRKNMRSIIILCLADRNNGPAAQSVLFIEHITAVHLKAVGHNAVINLACHPIKKEVPKDVRPEKRFAIAVKNRRLKVKI